jgi:iron complex outermembrane receptor protein
MKLLALILVTATSAVPRSQAHAQKPDTSRTHGDTVVYRVPEIHVHGVRPVTTPGGSSAIEVSVDSLLLPAAPTVEAVLREIPMLHVRTNSRGEAELSARGSESRQVAVLLDGVPLTLAWDSRTDVSMIPASAVQEIGFIRGLSSMLHGPNVLGGVVEMSVAGSFAQPKARSLQVATGVDHVGGIGGSATVVIPGTRAAGQWLLRAGASLNDSPGRPLASDVREPTRTEDNLRLNTDTRFGSGFLSFRYQGGQQEWLSFAATSFRAQRGIAAELGVENARFWRYPHVARTVAVASAGTGDRNSPFGGRGDVEMSLGVDIGRTDIDAYTSRAYDAINGFENGADRTNTSRLLADQSVGSRGELRGAFTFTDIRHDETLPESEARYRQRLISLGGENNWRLIESGTLVNSLRLSIGGAFDVAETPESGGREPQQDRMDQWGARAGFSAALHGGRTIVHAGVSRRGRFAALRELYSGALNRFVPNPDLRPETLVALESGITMRLGSGELQAVAFRHHLHDAVVRVTLPDRRFLRANRNQLNSTGVELLGNQTFGSVQFTGDLTVQAVDLIDTSVDLRHRPENLPEIFGRAGARFPLPVGFRGMAEADYIGEQFCIDPGTGRDSRLEAGTHLNVELSRSWTLRPASTSWFERIEGRLSVDNVRDVARYDQCGLPQPGRLLRLQVRVF